MVLLLVILSGLAWTVVYLQCIRVGLRERTYAMPLAALGLNIAWESIYGVHGLAATVGAQSMINIVWALADLGVVATFFRFGRAEFPALSGRAFVGWAVLIFATSYAAQWLFIDQFGWSNAGLYSAFLQNLLMSVLFIAMFAARQGTRGQSLLIAVPKWIGTLAPTILFGMRPHSGFVLGLGTMCSVFDLLYIGLLVKARMRVRAAEPTIAPAQPRGPDAALTVRI